MHNGAAVRRVLARRPWIYWLVVLLLAGTIAVGISDRLRALDHARSEWERTREVWVADRDLEAGDTVAASLRRFPLVAVPASAIDSSTVPRQLRQRVQAGEVIVQADTATRSGPAAGADDDQVVVPMNDPLVASIPVGVEVAVYSEGVVLAPAARVVHVEGDAVYVAVDEADGPVVAAAAHQRTASLAFLP